MTAIRRDSRSAESPTTIGIVGPPSTYTDACIFSLALELRQTGHRVATVTDLSTDIVLVNGAVPGALAYYFAVAAHLGGAAWPPAVDQIEPLMRSHCSTYHQLFRTTSGPTTSAKSIFDHLMNHRQEQGHPAVRD